MPTSTALVGTTHGSRYLQQLCKHWSHRFVVRFDPARGEIDFGGGEGVTLVAETQGVRLTVQTDDPTDLPELERVVEDHLRRFAFREELDFAWQRS